MKESLRRAGRTFLQTAIGYIAVNIVAVDFTNSKQALKSACLGLAISAFSAGIAAVMNIQKNESEE